MKHISFLKNFFSSLEVLQVYNLGDMAKNNNTCNNIVSEKWIYFQGHFHCCQFYLSIFFFFQSVFSADPILQIRTCYHLHFRPGQLEFATPTFTSLSSYLVVVVGYLLIMLNSAAAAAIQPCRNFINLSKGVYFFQGVDIPLMRMMMKDRLLVFNVVDIIKRTKNVLIAVVRHTFSCYHESRLRCKFFEFFPI